MEDNELWRRHVLTAVSQLTVSIYVFCKSWRGGDKWLLQAAIMLFTLGGIRCLEKPFALHKASINSLAADCCTEAQGGYDVKAKHLSDKAQAEDDIEANRRSHRVQVEDDVEANPCSDKARVEDVVEANHPSDRPQVEEDDVDANRTSDKAHAEDDVEASHPSDTALVEDDAETNRPSNKAKGEVDSSYSQWETYYHSLEQMKDQVNKLFVDLASRCSDRLVVTETFCKLDGEKVYELLQERLSDTFHPEFPQMQGIC
ncbi:hypothetical protein ACQ4PT_006356 [Festuca glaucescens]